MKRIISLLLALCLAFSLIGCGSSKNRNDQSTTEAVVSENQETASNSSDTVATESEPNSELNETSGDDITSNVSGENADVITTDTIPEYSGKVFIAVNDNIPNFLSAELTTEAYEKYSELDHLGRCGAAIASCGKEIMPKGSEKRGSISSITPTGWVQAQYDNVAGKYLYNRCHLIGWQLSAENANKKNLITGTRYMNTEGMLPFENMVADYINETGNHVAYRVTPVYEGDNLLASGVQLEAYSIEDDGEGICFNVYVYNVQPEITINYATGESWKAQDVTPHESTKPETQPEVESASEASAEETVWIPSSGSKYHSYSGCSNMKNSTEVTKTQAESEGYEPCKECW